MQKHKFLQDLEARGAKVTEITYRGHGLKIKGFDIEHKGLKVEIEPMQRIHPAFNSTNKLMTEYFVTFSMGNGSQHYTKRSKEGFLPPFCKDLKAFKNDIIEFFK